MAVEFEFEVGATVLLLDPAGFRLLCPVRELSSDKFAAVLFTESAGVAATVLARWNRFASEWLLKSAFV